MSILNDQRGQRSDELSFRADRALSEGDEDEARRLYGEAAELETELAADVPEGQPRLKSTLAVSAAALWMRSGDYSRTKRVVYGFLAASDQLTDAGRDELEALVDQVRVEQMLVEAGNDPARIAPLNVLLDGGLVRRGLAPTKEVKQREATLTSQLTRVVEWKLGMAYRASGSAAEKITSQCRVYSAPAAASSYGIRLFVLPGSQLDLGSGTGVSPAELVATYMELATAAREGFESLAGRVDKRQYLRSFATGFRDLAPDGEAVGTVGFNSPSWRHDMPPKSFEPRHRRSLSRSLGNLNQISPPESVEGILKGMDLTLKKPWIKLRVLEDDDADDIERFYLDDDVSTDELGDKLHRRVRVPLEVRANGRSSYPYALDVELME